MESGIGFHKTALIDEHPLIQDEYDAPSFDGFYTLDKKIEWKIRKSELTISGTRGKERDGIFYPSKQFFFPFFPLLQLTNLQN